MAKQATARTKPDAFADALDAWRKEEISPYTDVTIGSHIEDGKRLPTLKVSKGPSIDLPSPEKTKVKSVLLEFVANSNGRALQQTHTFLRFTPTNNGWEIKRVAPMVNPDLTKMDLDRMPILDFINCHSAVLQNKGLKSIAVEMKAPAFANVTGTKATTSAKGKGATIPGDKGHGTAR